MKDVFVSELEESIQKQIELDLNQSIKELNMYSPQEIAEAVERGMNSRLRDLSELIDVSHYM